MRSAIVLDCGLGPLLSIVESLLGRSRSAVENLAALRDASQLSDLADTSLIIVGHRDANGRQSAGLIRQLRTALPHVPIYLVADSWSEISKRLPTIALAGCDRVFPLGFAGEKDEFVEAVRSRIAAPVPEEALHSIVASALPEPCKSIVEWTIRNANQLHPVENAASHFGVLRREIARKLSVGGVVNYTTLRKMGRLLHLGELCGSRGMSLRRARNVLDFTGTVTRSEIRHAAETRDWIASAWHSPLVDNKAPAKAEVPAASPEAAD